MAEQITKHERDGRMLLNSVSGVGPITLGHLLKNFQGDPWKILTASNSDLRQVRGVGEQAADGIQKARASGWLDKEKGKLEKMGAHFLYGAEISDYLKELSDPPVGLYSLGKSPQIPCISIVGTRVPSTYGKKMARKIAAELAESGICIVSGMARGVDSEAHKGALEAGGKTLAFLGSGLDVIYPPENLNLYREIQKSGAVLSEFPLGRRADRRTFPMRNRLVAGVSLGVLVIESAKAGGSMITARFAAEQGRTVFALPGRVDQAESQGCLDLLRDGATLIRNSNDILEELAPMLDFASLPSLANSSMVNKNDYSLLEADEQSIMKTLTDGDTLTADRFHHVTKLPLVQIMPALTMLEIRGLIIKRADGSYEAT
jgi:DNA processing protein